METPLSIEDLIKGQDFCVRPEQIKTLVARLGRDEFVRRCVAAIRAAGIRESVPLEEIPTVDLSKAISTSLSVAEKLEAKEIEWASHWKPSMTTPTYKLSNVAHRLSTFTSGYARGQQACGVKALSAAALFDTDKWLTKTVGRFADDPDRTGSMTDAQLRAYTRQNPVCGAFPIYLAVRFYEDERKRWPAGTDFRVIDPCAGWGDRLAAAMLVGCNYTGFDVWPVSNKVCQSIMENLPSKGGNQTIALYEGGQFPWPTKEKAHLVFTSPPYGTIERYDRDTPDNKQAWRTCPDWVKDFYIPLLKNAKAVLLPGGRIIINIDDTKEEHYVDQIIIGADQIGLSLVRVFGLMQRKSPFIRTVVKGPCRGEPILVFEHTTNLDEQLAWLSLKS